MKKGNTKKLIPVLIAILVIYMMAFSGCGGGSGTSAPQEKSFQSLQLVADNPEIPVGFSTRLKAIATYSDGSSADVSSACDVSSPDGDSVLGDWDNDGEVGEIEAMGTREGNMTITVTYPDARATASCNVRVSSAVLANLYVYPATPSIAKGYQKQFSAIGVFSNNTSMDLTGQATWSSTNTAVATVSNSTGTKGLAVGVATGSSTIKATMTRRDVHTVVGSTTLTVTNAVLTSIEVTPDCPARPKGVQQQMTATGVFSDNSHLDMTTQVTWAAGDPGCVGISNTAGTKGLATALDICDTSVTATDPVSGKIGTTPFHVICADLVSIEVIPGSFKIPKGLTKNFRAMGLYTDGKKYNITSSVMWMSDQMGVVANVYSSMTGVAGQVYAIGTDPTAGNMANIMAHDMASGKMGMAMVTVTDSPLSTIEVCPAARSIILNGSWQYCAKATYVDGTKFDVTNFVTWVSFDDTKVVISNADGTKGVATGIALTTPDVVTPLAPADLLTPVTIEAIEPFTGINGLADLNVTNKLDPTTLTKWVDALPIPAFYTPSGPGPNEYTVTMTEFFQQLHNELLPTRTWGYNGTYPGGTFLVHQGTPITVHFLNQLPDCDLFYNDLTLMDYMKDLPMGRAVVHLHGGHVLPENDGDPEQWYTADGQHGADYTGDTFQYPNDQRAATLWYHDHAIGVTRLNTYAGLAGFYLIRDAYMDSLQLPTPPYELGVVFQDKEFLNDGTYYYPADPMNGVSPSITPEHFGDTILVNGKVWPKLDVEPRRYRFHFLNGSSARFYHIFVADSAQVANNMQFMQIGTEQGLLPAPVNMTSLTIAPGERCEMIFDFAGKEGQTLYLMNDANIPYPNGDPIDPNTTAQLMQINVSATPVVDPSVIPASFQPITPLDPANAAAINDHELIEIMDDFGRMLPTLDAKRFMDPITEFPKLNTTEVWRVFNSTPDTHPIHLHLVQFQILDRQPFDVALYKATKQIVFTGPAYLPDDNEKGWKDTMQMRVGEVSRIIMKFDILGKYVWHCHILEHEEYDMMRYFQVVP